MEESFHHLVWEKMNMMPHSRLTVCEDDLKWRWAAALAVHCLSVCVCVLYCMCVCVCVLYVLYWGLGGITPECFFSWDTDALVSVTFTYRNTIHPQESGWGGRECVCVYVTVCVSMRVCLCVCVSMCVLMWSGYKPCLSLQINPLQTRHLISLFVRLCPPLCLSSLSLFKLQLIKLQSLTQTSAWHLDYWSWMGWLYSATAACTVSGAPHNTNFWVLYFTPRHMNAPVFSAGSHLQWLFYAPF